MKVKNLDCVKVKDLYITIKNILYNKGVTKNISCSTYFRIRIRCNLIINKGHLQGFDIKTKND